MKGPKKGTVIYSYLSFQLELHCKSSGAQVHNNSKETVSIVSIAKTQRHIKILEASLALLCATGPGLAEKSATFAFGVYTLNVNIVADLSAGPRPGPGPVA